MNAVYPSAVLFTMLQGKAQAIKQYQGEKCKFRFSVCSAFQEELRASPSVLSTSCKKAEFLSSNLQGNKKDSGWVEGRKKNPEMTLKKLCNCTVCEPIDE